MRTYEAMFLLDASNTDIEAASVPVRELLDRIRAEVLVLKLWDERRLAYEVKGRRRGMYLLTYFKAEPANVTAIDHEVQLDERILRAMVLSADHVSEERMNAETPGTLSKARRAAAEAERGRKAERTAERKAPKPADKPAEDGSAEPKPADKPAEGDSAEPKPADKPAEGDSAEPKPADKPQAPAEKPDEKPTEAEPPGPPSVTE